jgi:hypothetical protein
MTEGNAERLKGEMLKAEPEVAAATVDSVRRSRGQKLKAESLVE